MARDVLDEVGLELGAINDHLQTMLALMQAGQITRSAKQAWDEWIVDAIERLERLTQDLTAVGLNYEAPGAVSFRLGVAGAIRHIEESSQTLILAREAVARMRERAEPED